MVLDVVALVRIERHAVDDGDALGERAAKRQADRLVELPHQRALRERYVQEHAAAGDIRTAHTDRHAEAAELVHIQREAADSGLPRTSQWLQVFDASRYARDDGAKQKHRSESDRPRQSPCHAGSSRVKAVVPIKPGPRCTRVWMRSHRWASLTRAGGTTRAARRAGQVALAVASRAESMGGRMARRGAARRVGHVGHGGRGGREGGHGAGTWTRRLTVVVGIPVISAASHD